uniref:Predicted protein n=1 Tax=Hordeum vulgare subsp. vulgare TaxID=112509 RepID=F2CYG1_HORVV|nr:predicted protein [Hordeum vulgare subsp. vulgare]
MDPPHLSLSLKQISQAVIADSLTHHPYGCRVSSLTLRCCQPLPFDAFDLVVAWAGNLIVLSDALSKPEVWLADARYEQLLTPESMVNSIANCWHACMDIMVMLLPKLLF